MNTKLEWHHIFYELPRPVCGEEAVTKVDENPPKDKKHYLVCFRSGRWETAYYTGGWWFNDNGGDIYPDYWADVDCSLPPDILKPAF